jgi:hypothetical protein
LVLDIAVRRIALEPAAAWAWTVRQVARWRGQPTVAPTPAFLERLKGRKEQVDQAIQERTRSAPRIEPRDDQPPPPPPTGDLPPPPRPAPKPPPAPAPTAGGDYMSKLREAKRRAMEERQKAGGELPPEG